MKEKRMEKKNFVVLYNIIKILRLNRKLNKFLK
jgi:hypothetical protein